MHIDVKFRKMKGSAELEAYLYERFQRLTKFETKPVHVEVTFCVDKLDCKVDVNVRGRDIQFHAQAVSDNFLAAIDTVAKRVAKQMARKKSLVQDHQVYENSVAGKMDRLSEEWTAEADEDSKAS